MKMKSSQKTMMVPARMYEIIRKIELSGVSFTNVVMAALIQYLLSPDGQANPRWMELAIQFKDQKISWNELVALAREVHPCA